MRAGLVGCGRTKSSQPGPANTIYTSSLFRKSYDYSQKNYDVTYILSAKHGLMESDKVIEPYDLTPAAFLKKDATRWGAYVAQQIREKVGNEAYLYFLAGEYYYNPILPFLRNPYQILMKHLRTNQRQRWLNEQ